MDKQRIIEELIKAIKLLESKDPSHEWWHTWRVWRMARHIGAKEGADTFIVELTALLHDVADWKFHGGDETVGPKVARQLLSECAVPEEIIDHVCEIISTMTFKGAGVKTEMRTLEGKVVQDADRLDAIGAIGIARVFAFINRPIHDPEQKPVLHQTKEDYFTSLDTSTSINHFYEKLLLLKDRMNTQTAREIAEGRHRFMKEFLDRFFREWEGKI